MMKKIFSTLKEKWPEYFLEILLLVIAKTDLRPVRDNLWVEIIKTKSNSRAARYGILYNVPDYRFAACSFKSPGGAGRPNGTIKIELL